MLLDGCQLHIQSSKITVILTQAMTPSSSIFFHFPELDCRMHAECEYLCCIILKAQTNYVT